MSGNRNTSESKSPSDIESDIAPWLKFGGADTRNSEVFEGQRSRQSHQSQHESLEGQRSRSERLNSDRSRSHSRHGGDAGRRPSEISQESDDKNLKQVVTDRRESEVLFYDQILAEGKEKMKDAIRRQGLESINFDEAEELGFDEDLEAAAEFYTDDVKSSQENRSVSQKSLRSRNTRNRSSLSRKSLTTGESHIDKEGTELTRMMSENKSRSSTHYSDRGSKSRKSSQQQELAPGGSTSHAGSHRQEGSRSRSRSRSRSHQISDGYSEYEPSRRSSLHANTQGSRRSSRRDSHKESLHDKEIHSTRRESVYEDDFETGESQQDSSDQQEISRKSSIDPAYDERVKSHQSHVFHGDERSKSRRSSQNLDDERSRSRRSSQNPDDEIERLKSRRSSHQSQDNVDMKNSRQSSRKMEDVERNQLKESRRSSVISKASTLSEEFHEGSEEDIENDFQRKVQSRGKSQIFKQRRSDEIGGRQTAPSGNKQV